MANLWNQDSNAETKKETVTLNSYEEKNSVTVIITDMTIVGNVETLGDIVLEGKVLGNVKCNNITVQSTGVLDGNINANNVTLANSIKGNVNCSGAVLIKSGTNHVGDISADSVICEGSIQGNIKCKNCLQLKETAIIKGNCTSACFSISDGAIINGKLTTKR